MESGTELNLAASQHGVVGSVNGQKEWRGEFMLTNPSVVRQLCDWPTYEFRK